MKNLQKVSLDHLNLTVENFCESVSWYERVFGFEMVEHGVEADGPWGILRSGDSMLCIYESPGIKEPLQSKDDQVHQIYHFGLRVHDGEKWEKVMHEYSISTYYGSPVRYPHSTSWYVKDPTGYIIEVALWNLDEIRF